jgi:hypothetical protein
MAKKPHSGMNEEEIIRRRDGVTAAGSDEPLDSDAKRALADARLRALAFALSEQRQSAVADQTDDAELLAYLLDTLPEQRRMVLEEALRGNARAFGRLMTLRATLSSQTDKRDRQRADDPAREIPRHDVGRVDIRPMGELLQFRDAARPRASSGVPRTVLSGLEESSFRYRASRPMEFRRLERPRLQWGPKTEVMLRNLLERTRRDLAQGISLINETQSRLDRWRNISRRDETEMREDFVPVHRDAENLRRQLTELLRELEAVANRINDELGDVAAATPDAFSPTALAASLSLDRPSDEKAPLQRWLSTQERWADAFDLEAGPWAMHLTGTAVPTPRLVVSLRGDQVGMPSDEPFLTLVRPAEGFETVNLDSSGTGEIALPTGESVMLLQGDEVWEVRLSFRDR